MPKDCTFAANKNDKDMKTYSVHYKNAYANKLIIVAAENALQAVNECMIRYTERDLHGNIYIPNNHEFTAELIENVYSKKNGIMQVINL